MKNRWFAKDSKEFNCYKHMIMNAAGEDPAEISKIGYSNSGNIKYTLRSGEMKTIPEPGNSKKNASPAFKTLLNREVKQNKAGIIACFQEAHPDLDHVSVNAVDDKLHFSSNIRAFVISVPNRGDDDISERIRSAILAKQDEIEDEIERTLKKNAEDAFKRKIDQKIREEINKRLVYANVISLPEKDFISLSTTHGMIRSTRKINIPAFEALKYEIKMDIKDGKRIVDVSSNITDKDISAYARKISEIIAKEQYEFENSLDLSNMRSGIPSDYTQLCEIIKKPSASIIAGFAYENIRPAAMYDIKTGDIYAEGKMLTIRNGKMRIKKEYQEACKELTLARFESARSYIEDLCREYSVKCITVKKVSLRHKDGEILIRGESGSVKLPYQAKDKDLTAWKREMKKVFARADKELKKIEEDKYRAQREKYAYWTDSFLCMDILRFIRENESYITENAVVQAMRGVQIALNTTIKYTDGMKKYNMLPASEIEAAIGKGMHNGLILTRKHRGTYGKFFTLYTSKEGVMVTNFAPSVIDAKEAMKKMKQGEKLSDAEAQAVFQNLDHSKFESRFMVLDLLHSHGFAARYLDQVTELFRGCDKDEIEMLKMREEMEEDKVAKSAIHKIRMAAKKNKKENT